MTDILAQSLANLANARNTVLEEMKNRYPVGSEVSWKAGKGFSTGHVIGHAPFWTREPTRLRVKPIRNGKARWVTPYNIPLASYAAPHAQSIELEQFRPMVQMYIEANEKIEHLSDVAAWAVGHGKRLLAKIDESDAGMGVE